MRQAKLSIYKDWRKIEQKFGIDAWENVREFIWKQQLKIEELTKSRDTQMRINKELRAKIRELKKRTKLKGVAPKQLIRRW